MEEFKDIRNITNQSKYYDPIEELLVLLIELDLELNKKGEKQDYGGK